VSVDGTPLGIEGIRTMSITTTAQNHLLKVEGDDAVGLSIAWSVLNHLAALNAEDANMAVSTQEAKAAAQRNLADIQPESRAAYGLSDEELAQSTVGDDAVAARQEVMSRSRYLESALSLSKVDSATGVRLQAEWLRSELTKHEVRINGWSGTVSSLPNLILEHDARLRKAVGLG
jgi:hypothetical protein